MKPNYGDGTVYPNADAGAFAPSQPLFNPNQPNPNPAAYAGEDKGGNGGKLAAGVGAAVVGGGVLGAGLMYAGEALASGSENGEGVLDVENIAEAQGQSMQLAHVSDGMSFADAFAAARAQVGPGGVFTWRGGVYGTYTQDEWNAMSPEDRAAFTDNAMDQYGGNVHHEPQHVTHVHHDPQHVVHEVHHYHHGSQPTPDSDPDLDSDSDPDRIHVIGTRTGVMNGQEVDIADLEQNGHTGIAVDIDRDGSWDAVGIDYNDSGELEENEITWLNSNGDDNNTGGYTTYVDDGNGEVIVEVDSSDDGRTGGVTEVVTDYDDPVDFDEPPVEPDDDGNFTANNDGFEGDDGSITDSNEPEVYVAENTADDGMSDFINDANVDMMA